MEHEPEAEAAIHESVDQILEVVDQPLAGWILENLIDADVVAHREPSGLVDVEHERVAWLNFSDLIVVENELFDVVAILK